MAKKKNLTDRQKRIRRRRRKSTMSRVVFALEIIILVVLMGGLFVYAKLGNMNYEDLNFENVDVNQSVEENQVMKGYTSIALVGLDSREGELDGDVNSDTMIIASINNDTKKVKLVSIYRDTYLRVGSNSDGENVYNKANSAFCTGGPEKMMTMMNKNLDLNIVDYVTVDFKGVAEAVELLGGIDVDLKEEEIEQLLCRDVRSYRYGLYTTEKGCRSSSSKRSTDCSVCANSLYSGKRFQTCGKTERGYI